MGFSTMPITKEEAKKLLDEHEGEVVSASKFEYFDNTDWFDKTERFELADDSITIFFRLPDRGFVEYCLVKTEDMSK